MVAKQNPYKMLGGVVPCPGGWLILPARLVARIKSATLRGIRQVDLNFRWPYDPAAKRVRPENIKEHSDYVLVSIIKRPEGFSEMERFSKIYKTYFAGPPSASSPGP